MAEEDLHYPPGAEPEKPAEAPKEEQKPEAPTEEKPPETPTPEAEKPKEEEKPPKPDEPQFKKRSIYDDLKDTRKEKNVWRETAITALKAQGVEVKGNETPEQLQALITEHKPTPEAPPKPPEAPSQPEKPASELEAYAKEQGLDPAALEQLVKIVSKQIPKAELSEEDKTALASLQDWRTQQRRVDEDAEIDAQMPTVKTTAKELGFEIHDDAEATKVMAEVKRLAHTTEFHDKPVEYIVFAKRAELSKLVSPKKSSFEQGSGNQAEGSDEKVDFGSGKVTPIQAQKATEGGSKGSYEIRRAQ